MEPRRDTPVRASPRLVLRGLSRDYAYVLLGLPLAVISLTLTAATVGVAVATIPVGVGLLLLPLALQLATGFAQLSRSRARHWGADVRQPRYRPTGDGMRGRAAVAADPRRWLDLAFETLIALPLRAVLFVVAVTWTAVGIGGATYWYWGRHLPTGEEPGYLVHVGPHGWAPASPGAAYVTESALNLAIGLIFLATLPLVLRALARIDATAVAALLGGAPHVEPAPPPSRSTAPRGRRRNAWTWTAVTTCAVALVAVGWPLTATGYAAHPAWAMTLTIAQAAALVLAVRWPWAALPAGVVSAAGLMVVTAGASAHWPWPWPITVMITHCLIVLTLSLRHPWYWTASLWASGAMLSVLAPEVLPHAATSTVANGAVLVSVSGGLALTGVLVRLWTITVVSRAERAEHATATESARRRELEERNRIARELHDIVAHSMSVITVQASTAAYRRPGIDQAVQQEFDEIAASSRRALAEMRGLLEILRAHDSAPTAPLPGLPDIGDLVESTRASGVAITYTGTDVEVPEAIGLTAFRVVQEALSNALRHAPGSAVDVSIAPTRDQRALRAHIVNTAPADTAEPGPGSRLGLAGIRERVSALGGQVAAGPTPDGGFEVVATLPLTRDDPLPT